MSIGCSPSGLPARMRVPKQEHASSNQTSTTFHSDKQQQEAAMAIGRRKSDSQILGKWNWDFEIGKVVFEDRVYSSVTHSWETQQRNIDTDKFRAIIDLPNLEVGWIAYLKGVGLDTHLVRIGQDYGDRPIDKHDEGLRLLIKADASLGAEVRELISTARNLWNAFDALHDQFLLQAPQHPGCLPNCDIVDLRQEKVRDGTILCPVPGIVGWMSRPPLPASGIPLLKRSKKSDSSDAGSNGYTRPTAKDQLNDEIPF
jgi:hypothetical protein